MNRYILPASVVGTIIGCGVLLKDYVSGGTCPSKAKIIGKTVVITGANTGLGKETAKELAKRGGRVIMGCRDMVKCEAAAREIRRQTLNSQVYARHIDLASIKSIREFANRINQVPTFRSSSQDQLHQARSMEHRKVFESINKEESVDILINNAGVMRCPNSKTEDGFEMQLGVNHLGHYLLTNLLLEKLKSSAPSRVINLSSLAHIIGEMDFDDLNWERKKYNTKLAYCQSKLANILFTRELARRLQGSGVTVNAVHPGVAATELGRYTGLHQSQFSSSVLSPLFYVLVKTAQQGAQPSVFLAVAPELEGVSGRYYDVLQEKEPSPRALDESAAHRLWEVSAQLVGLDQATPTEGTAHPAPAPAPALALPPPQVELSTTLPTVPQQV